MYLKNKHTALFAEDKETGLVHSRSFACHQVYFLQQIYVG